MAAPVLAAVDELVEPVEDRASARAFAAEHIAPYGNEFERAGRIPEQLLERMSAAGIWAPFLPAEVGGAGLSMVKLGEIHEEVGRACSSVRSRYPQAEITGDQDIFSLGFVNSLFAMELVMFVEKTFEVTIPNEELRIDNFRTAGSMAELVGRLSEELAA